MGEGLQVSWVVGDPGLVQGIGEEGVGFLGGVDVHVDQVASLPGEGVVASAGGDQDTAAGLVVWGPQILNSGWVGQVVPHH